MLFFSVGYVQFFAKLLDRNRRGAGSNLVACAVGDDAAHLHSVPGGIGSRGGGSGRASVPVAP